MTVMGVGQLGGPLTAINSPEVSFSMPVFKKSARRFRDRIQMLRRNSLPGKNLRFVLRIGR